MEHGEGHKLLAPQDGRMTREITERASCRAKMRLIKGDKTLFEGSSDYASCEYVG